MPMAALLGRLFHSCHHQAKDRKDVTKTVRLEGGTPGAPKIEKRRETYFLGIYRGKRLHAIKIGLASRGQVARRIKNLQTGSVDKLVLLAVVEGSLERKFHRQFAGYRMGKSEFFKPAPALLKLIE